MERPALRLGFEQCRETYHDLVRYHKSAASALEAQIEPNHLRDASIMRPLLTSEKAHRPGFAAEYHDMSRDLSEAIAQTQESGSEQLYSALYRIPGSPHHLHLSAKHHPGREEDRRWTLIAAESSNLPEGMPVVKNFLKKEVHELNQLTDQLDDAICAVAVQGTQRALLGCEMHSLASSIFTHEDRQAMLLLHERLAKTGTLNPQHLPREDKYARFNEKYVQNEEPIVFSEAALSLPLRHFALANNQRTLDVLESARPFDNVQNTPVCIEGKDYSSLRAFWNDHARTHREYLPDGPQKTYNAYVEIFRKDVAQRAVKFWDNECQAASHPYKEFSIFDAP